MGISYLLKKPVVWGKPYTLFIEPTGFCNLSCPECVVGAHMLSRGKGNMKLEEFQRIIDEVQDHIMIIFLYFQGEPFINREIIRMIQYAVNHKMVVITSTNGHFFDTDEKAGKIIRSGIHQIIISLDGVTEESYLKYRRGGDYKKVVDGIQRLIRKKKSMGRRFPIIAIQFLVMKDNEHEIPLLYQKAHAWGVDQVLLKTVQIYSQDDMEKLLPSDEKYRRYEKKDGEWKLKGVYRNFCTKLWVGSVISWDSSVFTCCFDKDGKYVHENLHEKSFDQIWTGQTYQLFRKQVLKNRSSIDICRNCSEGQKIFFRS
jgi:MoaA/NifB/PqqE/SkfB family radical SAM enzyme